MSPADVGLALPPGAATVRRAVELDLAEQFPAEFCARLDAAGLAAAYVPAHLGGRLDDHERLGRAWRAVARQDLSTAIAHGATYLGAAPVWLAGRPEQVARTARAVLAGTPISCAMSEAAHGADLLNNSCTAERDGGGYRVTGQKWPINNATRSGLLTLLARTGAAGSPRGHSLFLVDKRAVDPGTWQTLPKVRTHGNRGIDLSGIELRDAELPSSSLIGAEGAGLETVLHTLQLTRTMCSALSLGAGEHALRIAARSAGTRPLAGSPYLASVLARCAARIAVVEAAGLVAVRSIHLLTGELSVTSVLTKALAPTLVDAAVGELADTLGAAAVRTSGPGHGAFQKVARDHQIVAVFDGSTPVSRAALIQQFPRLSRALTGGTGDPAGAFAAGEARTDLPPLDTSALRLASRTGCSVVQALPEIVAAVAALDPPADVRIRAAALLAAARRLGVRMAEVRPAARPPMAAYELAAAYELCFAGAACLLLWARDAANHQYEPLWADALWLRATLRLVTADLARALREPDEAGTPGDTDVEVRLAALLAEAEVLTPYGSPWPDGDGA